MSFENILNNNSENKLDDIIFESKEKEPKSIGTFVFFRHGDVGQYDYDHETKYYEGRLTEKGKKQAEEAGELFAKKYDPDKTDFIIWHSPRDRADETSKIILDKLNELGFDILFKDSLGEKNKDAALSFDYLKEALPPMYAGDSPTLDEIKKASAEQIKPEDAKEALVNNEIMFLNLARMMMVKVDRLKKDGNEKFNKNKETILLGVGHGTTIRNLLQELFPENEKSKMLKNLEDVSIEFLDNGDICVELSDGDSKTVKLPDKWKELKPEVEIFYDEDKKE
jgi:broad specificity phosphatase PhoE